MPPIRIKHVYAAPSPEDGVRVLVDRLWPRGLPKAEAALDHWFKDAAPSPDLRRWFGHDPARWEEFRRRYAEELRGNRQALERLLALAGGQPLTLLFAAHDQTHNHAVVLREALLEL